MRSTWMMRVSGGAPLMVLFTQSGGTQQRTPEKPQPRSAATGRCTATIPLARVSYTPEDLVTAADTTPEHARACQELVERNGGVYNAGPFTPWRYRAEGAPQASTLVFPGGLAAQTGGTAFDDNSRYVFVLTQDVGALGWIQKSRDGSPAPYEKTTGSGRGNFDVAMGGVNWPCQKPPWGRLTAVDASTGDPRWRVPS